MNVDDGDYPPSASDTPSITSPPPGTPGSPTSTISGYYPGPGETPLTQTSHLPYPRKGKEKGAPGSVLNPTASGSGATGPVSEGGPGSSGKRDRDPHRKKIEYRAAVKRKEAVKKLQHVLAVRTKGLPENGLANQLQMAADQLE